jgi:hypothetical protein
MNRERDWGDWLLLKIFHAASSAVAGLFLFRNAGTPKVTISQARGSQGHRWRVTHGRFRRAGDWSTVVPAANEIKTRSLQNLWHTMSADHSARHWLIGLRDVTIISECDGDERYSVSSQ